jgi:hypothetical protein
MKQAFLTCAGVFLGFLLGAAATHLEEIRAQSNGVQVYIKRTYPPVPDSVPEDVPGKVIVGFSCLKDNFVECYTAYTK